MIFNCSKINLSCLQVRKKKIEVQIELYCTHAAIKVVLFYYVNSSTAFTEFCDSYRTRPGEYI